MVPKLKPLPGRVVLFFRPPEEKSAGGIIISQKSQRKSEVGELVAIGDPLDSKQSKIVANLRIGAKIPVSYGAGTTYYFGEDEKYKELKDNYRAYSISELAVEVVE